MNRLKPEEATDAACVRCHATPKKTGFPSSEAVDFRLDESVGCESCHGPGQVHVAAGGGEGNIEGLGEDCPVCVLEAMCTSCHNPTWDPDWNLDAGLAAIAHGVRPDTSTPEAVDE
jgi:hypothetical protein